MHEVICLRRGIKVIGDLGGDTLEKGRVFEGFKKVPECDWRSETVTTGGAMRSVNVY